MRIGILTLVSGVVLAAGASSAAIAKDQNGYAAITTGDYAKAERTLTAERKIFPDRPELMINLASVYRHTGRASEARTLYQAVLDQPDLLMDVSATQTAWSHALARAGLKLLDSTSIASR